MEISRKCRETHEKCRKMMVKKVEKCRIIVFKNIVWVGVDFERSRIL